MHGRLRLCVVLRATAPATVPSAVGLGALAREVRLHEAVLRGVLRKMNLELAAAELRWYFRLAPGEVGLSSNFGPMVRRLQGIHAAPNGVPVDGQRMAAAGRMSRIEVRLKRLASSDQYVVRLAFSGETHRDLVRVLLTMPSAQAAFVQSKSKRSLFAWV